MLRQKEFGNVRAASELWEELIAFAEGGGVTKQEVVISFMFQREELCSQV